MDDGYGYVVKIWCHSPSPGHRRKGNLVAAWVYRGDGSWTPNIRSRKSRETLTAPGESVPDVGLTLYGNKPSRELRNLAPSDRPQARSVYTLACGICSPAHTPSGRGRIGAREASIPMTEKTLFTLLNGLRHAGRHDVDIADIYAVL